VFAELGGFLFHRGADFGGGQRAVGAARGAEEWRGEYPR
jgi:hypothetical protein